MFEHGASASLGRNNSVRVIERLPHSCLNNKPDVKKTSAGFDRRPGRAAGY